MQVKLTEYPNEQSWIGVKERALVTVGKHVVNPPTEEWKHKILEARHSPIRYLRFSFYMEDVPSWVSVHLARHVHAQPYIKSQRNDRQSEYDRNSARQDTPVCLIYDVNAEELMTIANKRLCNLASKETRELVQMMCDEVIRVCPEFKPFLVPSCVYNGECHEMYPCKKKKTRKWISVKNSLPKNGIQVLVNVRYPNGENEVTFGEYWDKCDDPKEHGWGSYSGGVITHWMYMPEEPDKETL